MSQPKDGQPKDQDPAPGHRVAEPGGDEPPRGRAQDADPPAPEEAPDAPGQRDDPDRPLSEEDALLAMSRGGDGAEHAEWAKVTMIADHVAERLRRDPLGTRIGTLALFNDSVSFGGGLNIAGGGPAARGTRRLRRIDDRRLAEHVTHFLPPPRFEEALRILHERRLLVLALPPGSGREAAALNLLTEARARCDTDGGDDAHAVNGVTTTNHRNGATGPAHLDDDGPARVEKGGEQEESGCYVITDSSSVAGLDWELPSGRNGYLLMLDDTPAAAPAPTDRLTAEAIDEDWMAEAAARLGDAGSFMVLVTGPPRGLLVEAAARSGHVLTSLGELDLVRVVERRVLEDHATVPEAQELRRRLAGTGALDLLREFPQPRVAVRLAALLRAGGDLEAEVAALRDPTGQVHAWFSQHRDLESTAFAVAVAVLSEATYLTVSDAAVALHEALSPEADVPPDVRFRDRLSTDHPWIEIAAGDGDAGRGAPPALPRVRFRNPLVAQAVLGYAWSYLDGRRSAVLRWLAYLVRHPDVDVRARASVAAGVVAWSDYNHALHRFLRSWAGDTSPVMRQGAATALGVVERHPHLTEHVWSLLESWVKEPDTPFQRRLSLTAATALGGRFGAGRPDRAVTALRAVLDRDDWGMLLPVGWSLVHLMEQGHVPQVLDALLDWSSPQDTSPMVTKALSVFVFALRVATPEPGEDGGSGNAAAGNGTGGASAGPPPLLLGHAKTYHARLVELWARSLARKPVQTSALEALRECLDTYGDRDPAVFRSLRDLVLAIAARPGRHRERLDWYLAEWARDGSRPARRLHSDLRHVRPAVRPDVGRP